MYPIIDVSDADIAFGNCDKTLPAWDAIPEEFKGFHPNTKWGKLFNDWFYSGLKNLEVVPKPGVDSVRALRHVQSIMRSWSPSSEHKEAACEFLFNEWLESAIWEPKK